MLLININGFAALGFPFFAPVNILNVSFFKIATKTLI